MVALKANIDWEAFRADFNGVHAGPKKSKVGAKAFDVVLKFKILVLQQLHNLSDDRTEFAIRDRLSFMRFLDLHVEDRIPDAKTIWVFREQVKRLGLLNCASDCPDISFCTDQPKCPAVIGDMGFIRPSAWSVENERVGQIRASASTFGPKVHAESAKGHSCK